MEVLFFIAENHEIT